MRINLKNQKGFTLTPALFILSLIMIAGTIYLLYINSSGKAVRKIETANIAKYAAEVGLLQMKSQFAQLNELNSSQKVINKWYNAKAFDYSSTNKKYIFQSSATTEPARTETNTARVSGYIELKDGNGKISSSYRITIEDGSFISSSKTSTGSSTQGKDKYGNSIWSDSTNKNFNATQAYYRYGVRVDGFSHDSAGNREKGSQSIYAVIDVPNIASTEVFQNWTAGSPAGFLLSTDGYEPPTGSANERHLNLISGQVITGKIHSNHHIEFTWDGNFDVFNSDKPNKNDSFTVNAIRDGGPNTAENAHPLIRKIVRETGQPSNQITIYGNNFSTNIAENVIFFNGNTTGVYPSSVVSSTKMIVTCPTSIKSVKLGKLIPATAPPHTLSYRAFVTYINPKSKWGDSQANLLEIEIPTVTPSTPPPMKVYGVHYVSTSGTGTDIYSAGNDYLYYAEPYNFLAWNPAGPEPNNGAWYYASYFTEENLPHNNIKVFDRITYSGSPIPKLYYNHSHRVAHTNGLNILHPFSAGHSHNEVFGKLGIKLLANTTSDYYSSLYSWNSPHRHEMNSYVLEYVPVDTTVPRESDSDDLFFKYPDFTFRPEEVDPKVSPLLAPNNVNFKSQRTYADQLLKIMLNKNLSKDANGDLNSLDEIAEDRPNGYYNLNGSTLDLRATYFGNELKYSAGTKIGQEVLPVGSPLDLTAPIYVDDDPSSTSYMKISDAQTTPTFKSYTYRQIPNNGPILSADGTKSTNGGIIFARNGIVRIGGAGYKGIPENYSVYNLSSTFGNNTIIDGSLTIVSYSEEKPTTYINNNVSVANDNKGDIVITGNVIYKNRISPKESDVAKDSYIYNGFRQYKASIKDSDPLVETDFITDAASKVKDEVNMPKGEKVNGLALIASNDIKIPVAHYNHLTMEKKYTTPLEEADSDTGCPCKDTIKIHGQLIAGHKITQTKVDDSVVSKNDRIILYGSFYSYLPPNLAYFGRSDPDNTYEDGLGRMYLYDKTLAEMPLSGTPRFPKDSSYTSETSPVVGTSLPRIVPGTWKVVSDGAQ